MDDAIRNNLQGQARAIAHRYGELGLSSNRIFDKLLALWLPPEREKNMIRSVTRFFRSLPRHLQRKGGIVTRIVIWLAVPFVLMGGCGLLVYYGLWSASNAVKWIEEQSTANGQSISA